MAGIVASQVSTPAPSAESGDIHSHVFVTLLAILFLPALSWGQGEVTSFINRYKQYEVSTGYYEQYEMKPRHESPFIRKFRGVDRQPFSYSTTASAVRNRSRLADSHSGIKFYDNRRCEDCHVNETHDSHTVRAGGSIFS